MATNSRVPDQKIDAAIKAYKRDVAESTAIAGLWNWSGVERRRAERTLHRLQAACAEVLSALDNLPEVARRAPALQSDRLRQAAAETYTEAAWRVARIRAGHSLEGSGKANKLQKGRPTRSTPCTRLEDRIGRLFVEHGGRLTTYDPRRHVAAERKPQGGGGARGGQLAKLLFEVYERANITPPQDLEPVLRRIRQRLSPQQRRKYVGPDPRILLKLT